MRKKAWDNSRHRFGNPARNYVGVEYQSKVNVCIKTLPMPAKIRFLFTYSSKDKNSDNFLIQ